MIVPSETRPTAGEILRGTDEAQPETVTARAGLLRVEFTDGDLRHLHVGDVEVVQRITVAVRDEAWNTLPPLLSGVRTRSDADAFEIAFTARHESGELCFTWDGLIRGAADGSCSFSLDGRAAASFPYRRIGICVLLPPAEFAGRRYTASLAGRRFSGDLPSLVAPPGPRAGVDVPLVPAFDRLFLAGRKVAADLSFAGDEFEIEDQRNWTDDSFKAYSRFPPVTEAPERMAVGTRLRQTISVSASVPSAAPGRRRVPRRSRAVEVTIGDPTSGRMPEVGLGHADESPPPAGDTVGLLARLTPAHLRVDLHLGGGSWPGRLERATCRAEELSCPLEVGVFLPEAAQADRDPEFGELTGALAETSVRRVLVYRDHAESTPGPDVAMMRKMLAGLPPGTAFAGGTDLYFAQLNRTRPDIAEMDAVVFPITPQVHNADEESILECADGVRAVMRTARDFCSGRPLIVSPISLRPRYNPDAPGDAAEPTQLPYNVDPRQISLFGAVWALVTLKVLAEERASATTWCETVGPRGLIENMAVPAFGREFRSRPGQVFPLYHVLRDACELRGARMLTCVSDEPRRCTALAARTGDGVTVLAANLRPEPVVVQLRLPRAGRADLAGTAGPVGSVAVRSLNVGTFAAMLAAETYRSEARMCPLDGDTLRLDLLPYEYIRVDYVSLDQRDG